MGHSSETPTVKFMLTKTNAGRLNETLVKYRDQLNAVTDDVGKAQRDFLDEVIGGLQSAMKSAAAETPAAPTPPTA